MIDVKNVHKRYGAHTAVRNLNFRVEKGEIVGFLGPNGAGKTTTMNIITGYNAATKGTVLIDGNDIVTAPRAAKKKIGYLPDTPPVYNEMRVLEYLNFVADIKGVGRSERKGDLAKIMEQTRIADVSGRLIKNLSRGYRQRVGLAQAMVGWPQVIIMDEPTIGLDPRQIMEMRDVIRSLGKKHTVMLSSHILQEIAAVCSRVIIINKGKIVASGTVDELSKNLSGEKKTRIIVRGSREAALAAAAEFGIIKNAEATTGPEPGTVEVLLAGDEGVDIREAVFRAMSKHNLPILLMRSTELSLEEIYLGLIDMGHMQADVDDADVSDADVSEDAPRTTEGDESE